MKKSLANILIGAGLVGNLLFNSSCNYEKPQTKTTQKTSSPEDTLLKKGANFYYKGDYNSAKKIYSEFLEIKTQKNDSLGIAKGFNNLGLIFNVQGNYNEAIKYTLNALNIYENLKDSFRIGQTSSTLGIIFSSQKKYEKALEYYNKSFNIQKKFNDSLGISQTLNNLGSIFDEKKNFLSALENLKKADTLAKEINSLDLSKDIYLNFSEIYELKGEPDSALKYHKKFSQAKDSLLNSESLKQVAELETKYQTEKKELENTALKKDNQIVEEKNKKQQWGLFGLAACLGLGGIFSYSMYKSRKKIKKSKKIIEEKNKEITDSINYAKNIQNAILPNELETKKLLGEHFIFYKPKDIVSGDFYWTAEKSDKAYFAACDCTGHGIPGAFMSVLNSRLLNNAIEEKQIEKPNEILNYVRTEIINSLKSKGKSGEQKDGMDAILCAWDKKTNTLEFACANNPLYLIRNNE